MNHDAQFKKLAAEARSRVKEISAEAAWALAESGNAVLVDVREPSEFEETHAEGAVNLSRGIIEQRIGEVAPDETTPVICYCAGGNRSALVAESLQKLGYTQVMSIGGGFTEWQREGFPIVPGPDDDE
jgi:rhodanese-related sulfurtransferase